MALKFREVPQARTKGSQVAEQILDAIRSGQYAGGDRLPPERDLAAAMGVSRGSVREAIGALQVAGIVQSRVGDGTYVAPAGAREVKSGVTALIEAGVDLLDIWKGKEEIEVLLLEAAARAATDEEIEAMSATLSRMAEGVRRRDYRTYLVSNVRFHLAIAKAARNPSLAKAENALLRVTQQIYRAAERGREEAAALHLDRALAVHETILDVLRERNPEGARRAMRAHFNEVASFLRNAFA